MTTPSETTTPFGTPAGNDVPEVAPTFSFRTMQDDLLNGPKKDFLTPIQPSATSAATQHKTLSTGIKAPAENIPSQSANTNPNPFLNHEIVQQIPKKETSPIENLSKPISEKAPLSETKIVEIPQSEDTYQQVDSSKFKIIITVIVFLVVSIIGLTGYYFWLTSAQETTPPVIEPIIETIVPVVEEPPVIEIPVEKYSASKPNFIVIDLANASGTEIQSSLSAISKDSQNLTAQTPYEFTVVDSNNNPVAFPIFATALKLNFSPELLGTLGETFSLFIYNDRGNSRIGLSTSITKKDVFTKEIQKQEKTLPADLAVLFLGAIPDSTIGTFKDGSYNTFKTRYLNLNMQGTLSVDYSIKDDKFIFSTSRDTQRAILDKLSLVTTQPEKQTQSSVIESTLTATQNTPAPQPLN